jgi:hypothetical protein
VIIANQYRLAVAVPQQVIDNYQTQTSTAVSSSGGAVTFDVSNVTEAKLQDLDLTYTWAATDPMNLMTQARDALDLSRGIVFDWPLGPPRFYELAVPAAGQDWRGHTFLRLRACQGSRHPETVALAGSLDFTVTLRDATGVSSSIPIASFATITRPYQRSGAGTGSGWANEFCGVRVRLSDFENDGSGLDLGQIAAVRLEFGTGFGSARGRLGLDDIVASAE